MEDAAESLRWGGEMHRVEEMLAAIQVGWVLRGWVHRESVEEVKVNE